MDGMHNRKPESGENLYGDIQKEKENGDEMEMGSEGQAHEAGDRKSGLEREKAREDVFCSPHSQLIMSNNKSNSAKTAKQLLQERQAELVAEVEHLEQAVHQEEEEDRQRKEEENKHKAEER
ncbi:hypothetical protein EDB19DRAFT_1915560 [Suillus lakei]|nr:hypothetical protein EDB19DRAFT_1915560 [Suillus lakei]